MRISDELLHDLGEYYNSEFVKNHMPWIRALTFGEWLRREMERRQAA